MRKHLIAILLYTIVQPTNVLSQEFVNGSFESDSMISTCSVPYFGVPFTAEWLIDDYDGIYMLYGSGSLGMCSDSAYYPWGQLYHPNGVVDGSSAIVLEADSLNGVLWEPGFALELTSNFMKDSLYEISFYKRKIEELWEPNPNQFASSSEFAIGLSNDSTHFGHEIYYGEEAETVEWQFESFSFIPDSNYKFMTLQARLGETYGSKLLFLDHFVLTRQVGVEEMNLNKFKVYPSVVEDLAWVSGQGIVDDEINVFNSTGKLVKSIKPSSNSQTIDLSDLDAGIYLVSIAGYKTVRIIKN